VNAAADIKRTAPDPVADLLEQPPTARLQDPGLKLQSLEFRGLSGQQVFVAFVWACNRHLSAPCRARVSEPSIGARRIGDFA
jgi:hypothetical protein